MESTPGPGRTRDLRSGGKILRPRRAAGATTPYDRPGSQNLVRRNPNWISRFIYSPSRVIASKTGKILTSVFVSDSSSSSGSSANASDDDLDDDDKVSVSLARDETTNKIRTGETTNVVAIDPSPVFWRKETKRVIEQLILQEMFSREECDRLTMIIKSRVVDLHNVEDGKDERQNEFPDDVNIPELSNKVIREARKWLKEKKGSNLNSKLEHGSPAQDSSMLPRSGVSEVGSPVYMAKSYMRTHPAWTSPSARSIEHRSSSPFGFQHFPNEIFFSGAGFSVSSSKVKLRSQSARSWNLREELRRVRSKATENLLKNLSSPIIEGSPFSSEQKHSADRWVNDLLEAGKEDEMHDVDTRLNMDAGGSSGFQVVQNTQKNCQTEALANLVSASSQCNQDMESEKADGVTVDDAPAQADAVVLALKISPADSVPFNGNYSTLNEATGTGVAVSNGFLSSEPSLSAIPEPEPEPEPVPGLEPRPVIEEEESHHTTNQGYQKDREFKHVETNCVLLCESSLEKPIVDEDDSIERNSSSIPPDESESYDTQPVEKQVRNKSKRGRGRGRVRGRGRGKSAAM